MISGSGNVAIYATEKATTAGSKGCGSVDSNGYVYDPEGIKLDVVKQIKEVERKRIKEYAERVPSATYTEGCAGIWSVKCDIALPALPRTSWTAMPQRPLSQNGVIAVAEGANMPCTPEAVAAFPGGRRAVWTGKSCKRRRCSYFRAGDEPELHEIFLDLRGSGRKTP